VCGACDAISRDVFVVAQAIITHTHTYTYIYEFIYIYTHMLQKPEAAGVCASSPPECETTNPWGPAPFTSHGQVLHRGESGCSVRCARCHVTSCDRQGAIHVCDTRQIHSTCV